MADGKNSVIDKTAPLKLNGIMHKWANPHFDDFEKKSRSNMKYKIKRINTN